MASLEENIKRAMSDFDAIQAAIEEKGIAVPEGTDTSEYGDKIRQIQGSGTVDQTYNPESENAQSGKAVAEALSGVAEKVATIEEKLGEAPTQIMLKSTVDNKIYRLFIQDGKLSMEVIE